jgi:hypothetical protein
MGNVCPYWSVKLLIESAGFLYWPSFASGMLLCSQPFLVRTYSVITSCLFTRLPQLRITCCVKVLSIDEPSISMTSDITKRSTDDIPTCHEVVSEVPASAACFASILLYLNQSILPVTYSRCKLTVVRSALSTLSVPEDLPHVSRPSLPTKPCLQLLPISWRLSLMMSFVMKQSDLTSSSGE